VNSENRSDKQIRTILWLEFMLAKTEPERAVLRCALNLLRGVQAFEIDLVTGTARSLAAYEDVAASWAREYANQELRDNPDTDLWRHDFVMRGRKVQARYVEIHPQLAGMPWFPAHGLNDCVFCLIDANRAAGRPWNTGIDPVTGGVAKLEPVVLVEVMLPGMEAAA